MAIANEGDSQSYAYTGGMQSFTAPFRGVYKLEVWGATGAWAWAGCPVDSRECKHVRYKQPAVRYIQ